MKSSTSKKEAKPRISGKEAAYVALEALKRRPIQLQAPDGVQEPVVALVPAGGADQERKAPPRVHKPSPNNDLCVAMLVAVKPLSTFRRSPRPSLWSNRSR